MEPITPVICRETGVTSYNATKINDARQESQELHHANPQRWNQTPRSLGKRISRFGNNQILHEIKRQRTTKTNRIQQKATKKSKHRLHTIIPHRLLRAFSF